MRALLVGVASLVVTLLSGCAFKVQRVNMDGPQSVATILVGDPQVYQRESLINDRRTDVDMIDRLLQDSIEDMRRFGSDVQREVQTVVDLSAQLGVNIDRDAERGARRDEAKAGLQQRVDILKLQVQLVELRAQLQQAKGPARPVPGATPTPASTDVAADSAASSDGANDGGTPPAAVHAVAAADLPSLDAIEKRVGTLQDLLAKLTAFGVDRLQTNPREFFRDLQAYRDELRAARNAAQLDDTHDHDGHVLYRLRFPVTVLPPKVDQDQYALLKFSLDSEALQGNAATKCAFGAQPSPGESGKTDCDLYWSWLGHVTYRLNQANRENDVDGDSKGAAQRTHDAGLSMLGAATETFVPVQVFVRNGSATEPNDPCTGVISLAEASALNCSSITVAMPPSQYSGYSGIFPMLENLRLAIVRNVLQDPARSKVWSSQWAAPVPDAGFKHLADNFKAICRGKPMFWIRYLQAGIFYLAGDNKRGLADAASSQAVQEYVCDDEVISSEKRSNRLAAEIYECTSDKCRNGSRVAGAHPARTNSGGRQIGLTLLQQEVPHTNTAIREISSLSFSTNQLFYEVIASSPAPSSVRTQKATELREKLSDLQRQLVAVGVNLTDTQKLDLFTPEELKEFIGELYAFRKLLAAVTPALPRPGAVQQQAVIGVNQVIATLAEAEAFATAFCMRRDWGKAFSCLDSSAGVQVPEALVAVLKNTGDGDSPRGGVHIYSVAPTELAQRISTVSRAAQAVALAASMTSLNSLQGQAVAGGVGYGQQAAEMAQAIDRLPLVVGYAGGQQHDDCPSPNQAGGKCATVPSFGWVFGPKARVAPGNFGRSAVTLDFPPATFDVTVDLSVPAWSRQIRLKKQAIWVKDWAGGRDIATNPTEADETVVVDLPFSRPNFDAITRQIGRPYGQDIATARIASVQPASLRLCAPPVASKNLRLVIQGTDLWRNPDVSIAGVGANVGSIHVLPDMEGVSAEFDIEKLQTMVGADRLASLVVMTENGGDSRDLTVDDVVKDTTSGMCTGKPKPAPSALQPPEISRCAVAANLILALKADLVSATDGAKAGMPVPGCNALVDGSVASATCVGLSAPRREDGRSVQQCVLARITHRGLSAKLIDGRSGIPVTVQCGAHVQSETLALVGDKCGTEKDGKGTAVPPKGEPEIDAVVDVETKAAAIKACSSSATFVASGANLQTLASALLLAVAADSIKVSKDGTQATIIFKQLPVVPEKTAPAADKIPLEFSFTKAKKQTINIGWQKCSG